MVSRKKNKGKERKAKKEENKKAERHSRWERFARGEDENNRKVIHCDHGCTVEIPDSLDHPVVCFMDDYFATSVGDWWKCLNSHAKLWSNDNYRNMTTDILLSIGANLLLGSDSTSTNAAHIVRTIVVLDNNYKETMSFDEVFYSRGVAAKVRNICGGNMRDALKFYSKRTSCSCLKRMHLEARKTLPKVGMCYNCKETKERALLSVCSRCGVAQYCSWECQVVDWPRHEMHCDAYVRIYKQQTK